jgi:hypothetical protein
MRKCCHCKVNGVDESKQTFVYRCNMGNKWDACIRPVCDQCMAAGEYVVEDETTRLYLSGKTAHKESSAKSWWE